jgi:hypothetical protein
LLRSFDRDGAQQWMLRISDSEVITAITGDDDDRIYVASQRADVSGSAMLRRVTPDGKIDPTFLGPQWADVDAFAALTVSSQDDLVCAATSGDGDGLRCVDMRGAPRWSIPSYAHYLQARDGSIWHTTSPEELVRTTAAGAELWRRAYLPQD